MKTVLISGGTGLIGIKLSKMLKERGYQVRILSRHKSSSTDFVHWDLEKGYIDSNAFEGVSTIIHLAGEGIADARWTNKQKSKIIESRVLSTHILHEALLKNEHKVEQFISASATGYYSDRDNELLFEDSLPANDFLGETCVAWEKAVDKISNLGIRTVKLRTGVVLSLKGGALAKMIVPFKFGFGSALGNGKQWMSWIHEEDLCNMYIFAIENTNVVGAYNAVSPNPATNYEFSKILANVMGMPFWAPSVPAFFLKLLFGEMSAVVLGSTKASADKIVATGFHFNYSDLKKSLVNLLKK